ncbi:MAG: Flp pilus assembly complex ATPase component TadA, partial [Afipia sp.]|nr:Flp pilus assembly complex ATPase component TadA [Afipia sp.]
MAEISNPLLALLQERGLIDDMQLEEVSQELQRSGAPIIQILQDFGLLDMGTILQVLADHLHTEVVDIRDQDLSSEVISAVPATAARMHQCLPVAVFDGTVRVALADPLNPSTVDELAYVTGREIQLVVADPASIEKAINKHYGNEAESVSDVLKALGSDAEIAKEVAQATAGDGVMDLEDLANVAPIIKFVNLVLYQAVMDRASDIHFEPFEDEFKIRYRVDGALYEMTPPPKHLSLPVTSRIKVMANLDIAERRLPQDGRISLTMAGRQIDMRVSTLPTQFG